MSAVQPPSPGERELVITRTLHAPRELVWKSWTRPDLIARWWGPCDVSTRVAEFDLRPGGRWRYVMTGPDGAEYPVTGVFLEVVPPERIVTSDEFDETFQHPSVGDLPRGVVMTCTFEELDGRTRLTLRITHRSAEDRRRHEEMGVVPGWNSSLDRLDQHLGARARFGDDTN